MITNLRIKKATRESVSRTLLHFLHPNGGSFGNPAVDTKRAQKIIDQGLDAESLIALMAKASETATEEASRQLDWVLRDLLFEAEKVAERTDSLTFYRYVEKLRERIKQQEESETVTGDDGLTVEVPTGESA